MSQWVSLFFKGGGELKTRQEDILNVFQGRGEEVIKIVLRHFNGSKYVLALEKDRYSDISRVMSELDSSNAWLYVDCPMSFLKHFDKNDATAVETLPESECSVSGKTMRRAHVSMSED